MKNATRLLFTNHDFGHFFDDEYEALSLIAKVAKREWKLREHFETGTVGGSCNERTDSSNIPELYKKWKYVYTIDSKTYSVLYAVLDAFLNYPDDAK